MSKRAVRISQSELKRATPTKCRYCGELIQFKPHPQKKGQWFPHNVSDGEIHFNTCKKK